VDAVFSELGTSFFAAVLANDVARAEATLAEIEEQALITLRAAIMRPARGRRPPFARRGVTRASVPNPSTQSA
jgi:hypothetical protein